MQISGVVDVSDGIGQQRRNTMEDFKDYKTAIVLQGGGALGAYEFGVLKALYEHRPGFEPSAVTGLSIGAVNAAVLVGAKHDPIGTLEDLWRNKFSTPDIVPQFIPESFVPPIMQQHVPRNPAMFNIRPQYFFMPLLAGFYTNSFCDTSPLRETLKEVIDLAKLNDYGKTRVKVTAVNVETGELEIFDNKDGLNVEHVLASGSLPPGFPMTQIGNNYYWDGGVNSNTPLSPAINCLEDFAENNKREVIVVELIPMAGQLPRNIKDVMSRFSNLIFASKAKLDRKMFEKMNNYIECAQDVHILLEMLQSNQELKDQINKLLAGKKPGLSVEDIANSEGYRLLTEHKRIDAVTVIPFRLTTPHFADASDFSPEIIGERIRIGYQEAMRQGIDKPNRLTEGGRIELRQMA
jgi:predicted acylesterase/phospholipase RssA